MTGGNGVVGVVTAGGTVNVYHPPPPPPPATSSCKPWALLLASLCVAVVVLAVFLALFRSTNSLPSSDSDDKPQRAADQQRQMSDFHSSDFERFFSRKLEHSFVQRDWLLQELSTTLHSESPAQVILIKGDPGIGKSTLAASIVSTGFPNYRGVKPASPQQRFSVLAYHVCMAEMPSSLSVSNFIRNVASMLGDTVPEYGPQLYADRKIAQALNESFCESDPVSAFVHGVLLPLRSLHPNGLRIADEVVHLLVIDSLDESLLGSGRIHIANLLASPRVLEQLPSWLRMVATTRRANNVLSLFRARNHGMVEIDAHDARNVADVRSYVNHRFSESPVLQRHLQKQDLTAALIADSASGNFVVAEKLLDSLLLGQALGLKDGVAVSLDDLFERDFELRFPNQRSSTWRKAQTMFEILVASQQVASITRKDVAQTLLLAFPETDEVDRAEIPDLSGFLTKDSRWAVLHHQSTADWLTTTESRFRINVARGHQLLALFYAACFRALRNSIESFEHPWAAGPIQLRRTDCMLERDLPEAPFSSFRSWRFEFVTQMTASEKDLDYLRAAEMLACQHAEQSNAFHHDAFQLFRVAQFRTRSLQWAATTGDGLMLYARYLLASGVTAPPMASCDERNVRIIEMMVDEFQVLDNGLLVDAARSNCFKLVDNRPDASGKLAIHYAASAEMVQLLKQKAHSDVDAPTTELLARSPLLTISWGEYFGDFPNFNLDTANCNQQRIGALRALIAFGARADFVDKRGNSAMHLASCLPVLRYLVDELGLDPRALNYEGQTALMVRSWTKTDEVLEELVRLGVDARAADCRGRTALHILAGYGGSNAAAFTTLLRLGADPRAITNDGRNVLHFLAINRHPFADHLLSPVQQLDIDPNARDCWGFGYSPLRRIIHMLHFPGPGFFRGPRMAVLRYLLQRPTVRPSMIEEALLKDATEPEIVAILEQALKDRHATVPARSSSTVVLIQRIVIVLLPVPGCFILMRIARRRGPDAFCLEFWALMTCAAWLLCCAAFYGVKWLLNEDLVFMFCTADAYSQF